VVLLLFTGDGVYGDMTMIALSCVVRGGRCGGGGGFGPLRRKSRQCRWKSSIASLHHTAFDAIVLSCACGFDVVELNLYRLRQYAVVDDGGSGG